MHGGDEMNATMAAAYVDDEARWAAVLARDASADGAFFYAVRTTGVYCRPACPSRRPGRANVRFFETAAEARQAGFRACLRCRPGQQDARRLLVDGARRLIESAETTPTLRRLADELGVSPFHLQRVFRRETGVTPKQYAAALRETRLREELQRGRSVTEALYEAGYGSSRALYEGAGARLGMRPSAYRRGGQGERIAYAVRQSVQGPVLIAATARGVCAVFLGDESEMVDALRAEFPNALLEQDDKRVAPHAEAVLRQIEVPGVAPKLTLDARGSNFQLRVWSELRGIPPGETRTYADVARAIGAPGAARAVARACASNPLAIVTPCHRVVRSDGGAGGYRWGTERKQALLEAEAAQAGTRR
jgi:AraC family transcriptional regulator of adaptative response/methylated-DNA-[protein]-cysteine methyltransferase